CDGGIHLRASCDGEACDIHLGPSAFVKGKNFPLAKGDEIDVTGSRVTHDGGTSLLARKVRKGEAVLELRDEQGLPLWRKGRT
ncbi:MAG TPA: DNA-binding protein, partial [Vicinamibacteria bacterium]